MWLLSLQENPVTHISSILGSYDLRTCHCAFGTEPILFLTCLEVAEGMSPYAALWAPLAPGLHFPLAPRELVVSPHHISPTELLWIKLRTSICYVSQSVLFQRSVTTLPLWTCLRWVLSSQRLVVPSECNKAPTLKLLHSSSCWGTGL